ncbi:AMP-binding protein [Novosphingobium kaempferiae]|uniref:AMP-binding protein n=1 Tax=Novosphingobium kaempferiae TaxID=2896849 RepID=UPI001E64A122|nr:AMP-binding protein [Novosphingobium kaempferiae]
MDDPETLSAPDPQTVGGTLARAAREYAGREALIYDGRRATYAQLFEEVIERARGLIGLGVRPGDHVGVLMPNCWDYVVLYYAISLVSARSVLLNARYRPDDLAYVIPKARLRFLFVGGHAWRHCDYRPMLASVFPELAEGGKATGAPDLEQVIELGDERPGAWLNEAALDAVARSVTRAQVLERAAAVKPQDIGLMIFSSGTTSRPKACMLTHLSLCQTGAAMAERFRFTSEDKVWDPLPLFHMSTILPLAGCRATGACFMGMGHFDADSAMRLLIAEQPTVHYAGFPTIVGALVTHPDFARYEQSRLRINHVVGPPDLLRRYAKDFPEAVPVNSYGLTEATGVPCYSDLDDPQELLFETNGRVFDGMEVRVVDAAGEPVPDGVPGEICLRGYAIFAGYYDDAEATAAAVTPEGWLHTGDRGRIGPGGRVIYDGRVKDMLKIGGENVAAVELESFLMTHPAVKMAQVIGVPDDRLMEVAAAYIEVTPGGAVSEEELVRHCIGRIASYKIPRYVRFVTEWPMSATKVQKFELRENFAPTGKIDVAAMAKGA